VVVGLVACLVLCFWHLQVVRARYYRLQAENNRRRAVPIAAPRGPLLDRHGRVLVENRPSFNLVVTPEHAENLDQTVARLARILNTGEAQLRERLAQQPPFRPVVIKSDATIADVSAIEARRLEIPEVSIDVVPLRSYPLASAAAHTLGRVGEVTERQLRSAEFSGLEPGALVGQAGVESQYNRTLMGTDGVRHVIVNSRGAEVSEMDRVPPVEGPGLTLTLDADLQQVVEQALDGHSGTVVALDPQTGDVLAMASRPAYDPNRFATGMDAERWRSLSQDPDTPLMNRVIQGQYAPGSLFKIVAATAALEEGVITPSTTFNCTGAITLYNTLFHCNRRGGHGRVSLRTALAQSCNVFFYHVGVRLEIDRLARYAFRLGLGAPTGIDLTHEASGLIPTPEWKQRTRNAPWYPGETVSVAIGQGQVLVTPLQMARLAALVANGGRLVRPRLVKAVAGRPEPIEPPRDVGLRPETLEIVREGLAGAVSGGTAGRARIAGVSVAGKTGSAQVVSRARLLQDDDPALLPHAWFVCFAPVERPRIALAVLVEHGGSGGLSAAPIARRILSHFLHRSLPEDEATRVTGARAPGTGRPTASTGAGGGR
jgi:penicillin-binding protein 2